MASADHVFILNIPAPPTFQPRSQGLFPGLKAGKVPGNEVAHLQGKSPGNEVVIYDVPSGMKFT